MFPGVIEALDDGDEEGARKWVSRIADTIDEVAKSL